MELELARIYPLGDGVGYIELIDHMGNDARVVASARVSNLGESKGYEKDSQLIRYLLENRHTSPFEHVVFTFKIKCPLYVRAQWMRHRTWSYNEISRRYTSENIEFYIPVIFHKQSKKNHPLSGIEDEIIRINFINDVGIIEDSSAVFTMIKEYSLSCLITYETLLENGVSREEARMVLPQNLYTTFYGTVDLHNLFHFLDLRNSKHAQREIRKYAQAIEDIIKDIVPISYQNWKGLGDDQQ